MATEAEVVAIAQAFFRAGWDARTQDRADYLVLADTLTENKLPFPSALQERLKQDDETAATRALIRTYDEAIKSGAQREVAEQRLIMNMKLLGVTEEAPSVELVRAR